MNIETLLGITIALQLIIFGILIYLSINSKRNQKGFQRLEDNEVKEKVKQKRKEIKELLNEFKKIKPFGNIIHFLKDYNTEVKIAKNAWVDTKIKNLNLTLTFKDEIRYYPVYDRNGLNRVFFLINSDVVNDHEDRKILKYWATEEEIIQFLKEIIEE